MIESVAIRQDSDPSKVAVIGQDMRAVNAYARALRERGIEPTLFTSDQSMLTIPPAAREHWEDLADSYGDLIPDDGAKSSQMHDFN